MAIGQNKFARRQEKLGTESKTAARNSQPPMDEQLVRLEDDIRRLKVEFDIFFNGGTRRPPYDTKGRVETLIKRLGDERNFTFAQRYLYNTLVARYTAFRDLWRRTIQGREEGRATHVPARASIATVEAAPVNNGSASFVYADARAEVPAVKNLYDALIAAKRECGEPVDIISFPQFHRLVVAKTESLKENFGCERVRYSIAVENGQVSFKAKAEK